MKFKLTCARVNCVKKVCAHLHICMHSYPIDKRIDVHAVIGKKMRKRKRKTKRKGTIRSNRIFAFQ